MTVRQTLLSDPSLKMYENQISGVLFLHTLKYIIEYKINKTIAIMSGKSLPSEHIIDFEESHEGK